MLIAERVGTAPVLLLDDVFSELDPSRSAALLANLPPGQTLLTSAAGYPADEFTSRRLNYADIMLPEDRPATREAVLTGLTADAAVTFTLQ